jgi:hypothetical protein
MKMMVKLARNLGEEVVILYLPLHLSLSLILMLLLIGDRDGLKVLMISTDTREVKVDLGTKVI